MGLLSAAFVFADIGESEVVPWAWCEAQAEGPLPPGVSDGGDGKLLIWRRDASGAACFDFAETAGWAIADGTIHFYGGRTTKVASLIVPAGAADELRFVGEEGAVLEAAGCDSVFMVEATAGQVRCWKGLEFRGNPEVFKGELYQDGGAIQMYGGRLEVVECAFVGCLANELGGAIAAIGLTADSVVSNATFVGNCCNEYNGYGGAVYASAAAEGVTLTAAGCVFDGNWAANGGAIATVVAASAARVVHERPAGLKVSKSEFIGNEAVFGGGAVSAEGDVAIDASATLFRENVSGFSGGAINVMGSCREEDGEIGFEFSAPTVTIGRGVAFVDNVVSNEGAWVQGGAVALDRPDCAFAATGVLFKGNRAVGDTSLGDVLGGALALEGVASALVDTCVFDANDAVELGVGYDAAFGGAIDFCDADGVVKNCTFRGADVEAVSVLSSTVGFTNCVIVGNGLKPGYGDVYIFNSTVGMGYSAYGTVSIAPDDSVSTLTECYNLTGRDPAKVYAGDDTLRLDPAGFNPVAALGIKQEAWDFDGVKYGSKDYGSSMGAYETPTERLYVNLNGDKTYDGTTASNDVAWTWTFTKESGAAATWTDLIPAGADVQAAFGGLFTLTNWVYGCKDHGFYASTNAAPRDIDAQIKGNDDVAQWYLDSGVLEFVATGAIARRPVAMGGLEFAIDPAEYAWNGDEPVDASVTVVEKIGDLAPLTLAEGTDYHLTCSANTRYTANALATADLLNNWIGTTNGTYWITAYLVETYYDEVLDSSRAIGKVSVNPDGTTNFVSVAETGEIPQTTTFGGRPFAFDRDNSPTNGFVRRVDHAEGILRLKVMYYADANDDGIPDIYQRRILAKVVNGSWGAADATGYKQDVALLATLKAADGKWSRTGSGTASAAPAAGNHALNGFQTGGWLALTSQGLRVVDPAEHAFAAGDIPFLIYAYGHASATSSGGTGRTGRTGRTGGGSTPATTSEADLLDQYKGILSIAYATFRTADGKVDLKAKAVVSGNGQAIELPMEGATLKVYATEALGKPWSAIKATADAQGNVTVDLRENGAASCFFRVGL